jgi:spore maturation protein CgeB
MRWLAVHPGPAYSVHDTFVGWVEALRALGEHVVEYPLGSALTFYDAAMLEAGPGVFRKAFTADQATEKAVDRLCGALWKVRPDVLFIVSGFFTDDQVLDLARRDGTRIVLLCTEEPYEHDRHLRLAPHVDLILADDPTNLEALQAATRAVYMPKAYRPAVHHPGPADPLLACDFSFVGTAYPSRIAYLEAMDLAGLDVLLAGNWTRLEETSPLRRHITSDLEECLDNEVTANIYRSTAVGLNLYRREANRPELSAGWSMGPRELELAACGAFFLRDGRGEGDELLPMLPVVTSPAEATEQLRWWLAHPDERAAAAGKALVAVQDRTFDNNAARLLRLMEKG